MMTDDRVSTVRSRVERISRHRQSTERHRPSSEKLNPRNRLVIHVSVKPPRSARFPSNDKDKKSTYNNSAIFITQQNDNKSENSIKRLTSATRSVSVTKVHRSSSQYRQNSRKDTGNFSQKSDYENNNKRGSNIKKHRFPTAKVDHQENTNQSVLTDHIGTKKSLGTVEDVTNPIHKDHHLAKDKKTKNCCRCTRRRVFICLLSLIILGVIIAIILANLFKKTTSTSSPMPAYLRWNNSGITVFGTTNIQGNTSSQFYRPFGLSLDSFNNDLYIADRVNNRIQKCHIGESTCTTIAGQANAVPGTNMSDLNRPTYIRFDSNNNLYISDTNNQRIQFWNYGASYGKTIAGTTGISGSALNQLDLPYGIALDSNSQTVYISDCNNNRVLKYVSGASSGVVVAGGTGLGMNNTQLNCPAGIYLDSSTNSLIIANFDGSNIVRWTLGDNQWTIIVGDSNGLNGNTSTFLDHPTDFIFDPMGNMYIADMFNHRVQMYLVGQTDAITISGISGVIGDNSTMFHYPVSMVLDNQLNLYVTDSYNHRVQKFIRY